MSALGALASANDKSVPLVEDARRKLRLRDAAGALKSLADAVAADPGDVDAQILYQDVLRRTEQPAAVLAQYKTKAAAQADDPLAQYLVVRLGKPEDAARDFDKLQTKFPDS